MQNPACISFARSTGPHNLRLRTEYGEWDVDVRHVLAELDKDVRPTSTNEKKISHVAITTLIRVLLQEALANNPATPSDPVLSTSIVASLGLCLDD